MGEHMIDLSLILVLLLDLDGTCLEDDPTQLAWARAPPLAF